MSFEDFAAQFGYELENGYVNFDDEDSAEEFRGEAAREGFLCTMTINDDTGVYSVREQ